MRFGAEGAAVGAAAGVCCAGVAVEAGTAACACAYIASLVSSSLVSLEFTNLGINIYIYIYADCWPHLLLRIHSSRTTAFCCLLSFSLSSLPFDHLKHIQARRRLLVPDMRQRQAIAISSSSIIDACCAAGAHQGGPYSLPAPPLEPPPWLLVGAPKLTVRCAPSCRAAALSQRALRSSAICRVRWYNRCSPPLPQPPRTEGGVRCANLWERRSIACCRSLLRPPSRRVSSQLPRPSIHVPVRVELLLLRTVRESVLSAGADCEPARVPQALACGINSRQACARMTPCHQRLVRHWLGGLGRQPRGGLSYTHTHTHTHKNNTARTSRASSAASRACSAAASCAQCRAHPPHNCVSTPA
jgi:hypothetical protein